ncbi:MAG: glycosyltransferase family 4 protein [bacterium]
MRERAFKLLFVTHNYPPMTGGISSYAWELTRGLGELGIDVCVLTNAPPYTKSIENVHIVNFHESPFLGKVRRIKLILPLQRMLKTWQPDLVFLASLHPYGLFVREIAHLHQVPYVVGTHGLDSWRIVQPGRISRFERWAGKKALEGAAAVFSVSRFIAAQVASISANIKALHIIPNGVDCTLFKPGPSERDYWSIKTGVDLNDRFVICSVAALHPYKGHEQVFQALASLILRKPELIYLIAGAGPELAKLQKMVNELKLDEHVRFLGSQDMTIIPNLLRSSDLFILNCLPIPGEGFGIAFLEANACGLPVIAGNSGGVPDTVKDGETGMLINPLDPAAIADCIERLMEDANLRRHLTENGLRWAQEHDWSRIAQRYGEIIEKLIV